MKHLKNFTLFIFLLLPFLKNTVQAQEYFPFPQDNAVWYSVYSYPWPHPPYIYYVTYVYISNGDTIINGMEYSKFYSHSASDTRNKLVYSGAYRVVEDSSRVYFFERSETHERLAYDFSLLPGDTMVSNGEDYICMDTSSLVLQNGIRHKTLTILVPFIYNCVQTWVQGIGSLGFPLLEPYWGCAYTFESAHDLTCFFYKDEQIYEWFENPYFDGCIGSNVGIEEQNCESRFAIVPNPVVFESYLSCPLHDNTLYDYQIIDVNGRVLKYATGIKPDEITIQKNDFGTGIYLLRLFIINHGRNYSIKFIIN